MTSEMGRIWFEDSPWPNGHAVKLFEWSGRIEADGTLWFDLHLESVDYNSEHPPACDEEDDWHAPGVWQNYHRCILSSTYWSAEGPGGLVVGSALQPLEWSSLAGAEYRADELEGGETYDPEHHAAFRIYLTGHDGAADHRLRFKRGTTTGTFDIDWTGRIALAYGGRYEFEYTFRAAMVGVRFGGFRVGAGIGSEAAAGMFRAACRDAEEFDLANRPGGMVMVERSAM